MRDENGHKKMQQPLYCSYFVAKDYFVTLECEASNDCLNGRCISSSNILLICIGYEFPSMKLSS
jgi:hypothetical protein